MFSMYNNNIKKNISFMKFSYCLFLVGQNLDNMLPENERKSRYLFEPLPEFAWEAKWQKGTKETIERKPLMRDKKSKRNKRAKKNWRQGGGCMKWKRFVVFIINKKSTSFSLGKPCQPWHSFPKCFNLVGFC